MTRVHKRLMISGTEAPPSGFYWVVQEGYINHITATNSLVEDYPDGTSGMYLAYIDAALPNGIYPVGFIREVTVNARNYLIQQRIDIKGFIIKGKIAFSGGAASSLVLDVIEVSDDDRLQTQPTTPMPGPGPTVDRGVQWWQ